MERDPEGLDRTTLAAFVGAVFIGGANFIAVKFSNDDLAPLFGAMVRFAAAGVLLFAIAAIRRFPVPRGTAALGVLLYGVLGFGLAYGLMYYALVGLGPGTTSVIAAAVPLVTLVLAVLHGQERFSTRGLVGGVLAIAGILMLSLRSIGGDVAPGYLLAAIAAVFAIAESSVVIKKFPKAHPVTTNGLAMSAGALVLIPASLLFGEAWTMPQVGRTWLVLLWLVVVGSAGLFWLFLFVIRRWTASATVYALTLMPIVTVALGAIVGAEELTLELVVGAVLVMSAVYIGALARRDRPKTEARLPEAPPASEAVPDAGG